MGDWVWIGFGAFFVAALATGVRLILLWWRTGELPELLIGIGVLGIGPLGFGLAVLSQLAAGGAAWLSAGLYAVAVLAMNAGGAAKFVFNWRVYHAGQTWARVAACAAIALLVLATLWDLVVAGLPAREAQTPAAQLASWLRIGCLAWGSLEAFRWFVLMRRRERLGIATDPVVTNRFLLWGIAAGAAAVGSLVGMVAHSVFGVPQLGVSWVTTSSSLHGLVAAVAMWLAFLPPRAYVRWLDSSARTASA